MADDNARMVRVKFTEDAIYETKGPGEGERFKKGEVYEFPEHFAQRWIRRGKATEVDSAPRFKPLTRVADKSAQEEAPAEPAVDLEGMTKAELEDYAASRGVDLAGARTKAEIIEAIDAAS